MIWLPLVVACMDTTVVDGMSTTDLSDTTDGGTDSTDGPGTSGDTADPCPAALDIGSGLDKHQSLSVGDGLVLVHGPQNGWHVDLSAELRGTGDLMGFEARVTVVRDGVQIAGDQPATFVSLVRVDECRAQTAGLRFLVDDVKEPKGGYQAFVCSLEDAELDITLEATDLDSKLALTETVRVRGVLDKVDDIYNCP